MFLTHISVNNPVFATMMMLALAVVVAFGNTRMSVNQLPNVDFPIVLVATTLNNMSPGLCMFDCDERLVVCNTPYARMYGLTPELTKPGNGNLRRGEPTGVYSL